MKSAQIRDTYLSFFQSKQHTLVDSSPLVVKNDPTLMFTNAGMNQFKDIFLGNEPAKYPRIADTQKCLRVSGKHNDLEEVGVDTYHHTMFEMLGNWSFGDYYKREAIEWAWELLTEVYQIDKDRIYVTVFGGDEADGLPFDQEAFDVWKNLLPEDRILAASKKDNFWEMGETGPCGPCSEIHVDTRDEKSRAEISGKSLVNNDHPQVIEIWNLVFMEMQRRSDGSLVGLSAKHIDTGMGFERLCMVLQGKQSSYDTDVFSPLIGFLEKETGFTYTRTDSKKDIAFRVMADHVRAVSFAIADGQMPSNTGAGYVIRRILRRAVRYGYSFLDKKEPVMHSLAGVLISQMGDFFPELKSNANLIQQVIREEEESFLRTLSKGIHLIEDIIQKTDATEINGQVVFELYDTFGFPVDLTSLILSENGKTYNERAFNEALEEQKTRSRIAAVQDTGDWVILREAPATVFIGYDSMDADIHLTRYRKVKQKGKEQFQLVFDKTPFYPEGGGQIGDRGYVEFGGVRIPIEGTFRENNLIVHVSHRSPEALTGELAAYVATERRAFTTRNHTATHLLHFALRQLLGTHVEQKGSLVDVDYLRFDFSHFTKVSAEELRTIEQKVNAMIRKDMALEEFRNIPIQRAKDMGAIALFGEKYGDEVRVIRFGESVELCGGTHVNRTGEIGFFKILSEGSVASGIRRIEAITALAAENHVFERLDLLDAISEKMKAPGNVGKAIDDLLEENQELIREIGRFKRAQAGMIKRELIDGIEVIDGVNFIARKVELDVSNIKDLAFQLRSEMAPLFLVLATAENDKATISVALSDDLVESKRYNSGQIVKELAGLIGGGGGGQAFFATAGGKKPEGIPQALKRALEILSQG